MADNQDVEGAEDVKQPIPIVTAGIRGIETMIVFRCKDKFVRMVEIGVKLLDDVGDAVFPVVEIFWAIPQQLKTVRKPRKVVDELVVEVSSKVTGEWPLGK